MENCTNKGATTLSHSVTTSDNERKFRCLVNANPAYSTEITVCIQSQPSNVQLTAVPGGPISPSSSVTLRCTANVGNPHIQNPWSWEWTADNVWTRYPDDGAITDDPVDTDTCTNTGATTLLHTVTTSDNGRKFRCVVSNDDAYSAEVRVCLTSNPHDIRVTQKPDAILNPGDGVELKCSGNLGSTHLTKPWSWQWKNGDTWQRYPHSDRITDDSVVSTDCENTGATTLSHSVLSDDNGRMLRCLVNGDVQYAGNCRISVHAQAPKESGGIHTKEFYSMTLGIVTLVLFLE
ncbi:uncharacterized protein LOC121385738 [Gigantopelta aegis]|uniref:uncharacterized protein LOC121385738 n=1 Tax=Gigantopelta aegis TaxID=1735272 RepID=UPI001B88BA19|nr:uncharacterized protein LOC121385738 [Gigantopelta aegis]